MNQVRMLHNCNHCGKIVKCINYLIDKRMIWLCKECTEKEGWTWPS